MSAPTGSVLAFGFDVPIDDEWDCGDTLNVYWDDGSGVVDYTEPLNNAPIPIFKTGIRARGYGDHPYGVGHVDGRALRWPDFGKHRYGVDPYGAPPAFLRVTVKIPRVFASRKFGVRSFGTTGNATGAPLEFDFFVASDDPPPVLANALVDYDAAKDRVTMSFTDLQE